MPTANRRVLMQDTINFNIASNGVLDPSFAIKGHTGKMKKKILQKLYQGFVQLHILYHSKKDRVYGVWMMDELKRHGYNIGPGTLYPLLNKMEQSGLLIKEKQVVKGKVRKYYSITQLGIEVFKDAEQKAAQLFHEIKGIQNDKI